MSADGVLAGHVFPIRQAVFETFRTQWHAVTVFGKLGQIPYPEATITGPDVAEGHNPTTLRADTPFVSLNIKGEAFGADIAFVADSFEHRGMLLPAG